MRYPRFGRAPCHQRPAREIAMSLAVLRAGHGRHALLILLTAVALLQPLMPGPVQAAATDISVPCDPGKLTDAVNTANAAGTAIIRLAANCTYTYLTGQPNASGHISNALPVIRGDLTVIGNGATLRRDAHGEQDFRILETAQGSRLTLQRVTIAGGIAPSNVAEGGGIVSAGALRLEHTIVRGNRAGRSGPGGAGGAGGGIFAGGGL